MKRITKLEKRLALLESFLGLHIEDADSDFPEYGFNTCTWSMRPNGVLAELFREHLDNKKTTK